MESSDRLGHVVMPWGRRTSYSCAVTCAGVIYTSGHLGAEPAGAHVPFGEQARTALTRLLETIESAGGRADTIIKINAYLATIADFPEWDAIYRSMLNLQLMPARTTVQIGGFAEPLLLEIDAVALTTAA